MQYAEQMQRVRVVGHGRQHTFVQRTRLIQTSSLVMFGRGGHQTIKFRLRNRMAGPGFVRFVTVHSSMPPKTGRYVVHS